MVLNEPRERRHLDLMVAEGSSHARGMWSFLTIALVEAGFGIVEECSFYLTHTFLPGTVQGLPTWSLVWLGSWLWPMGSQQLRCRQRLKSPCSVGLAAFAFCHGHGTCLDGGQPS
jgi:hypothetical protein